jgi:hypothetical protein
MKQKNNQQQPRKYSLHKRTVARLEGPGLNSIRAGKDGASELLSYVNPCGPEPVTTITQSVALSCICDATQH